MPKCTSCGVFYEDSTAMELVRNKENRWVSICRPCLEKGVDVNVLSVANIAVEDSVLQLAEKPSVDVNVLVGDPVGSARKLLESLKTLRHTNEKVGRIRGHERHPIEMRVTFTLARDDANHEGVVRNLSQGGMLIQTKKLLVRGQVLQFDWKTPVPPAMAMALQGNAEVRRVSKNDDGSYAIGLRFVKRQAVKGANRRRFRRYKCDMRAFYQRVDGELFNLGKVKDISQGGCQLFLDEELDRNEELFIRIVGGGGGRGDLVGSVQVRRVIPHEIEFEAGCAFLQMRIERIEDLGKKKASNNSSIKIKPSENAS